MGKDGRPLLGSLSNDDGKKAIGLDWQNNNLIYTCITLFLYISLPSLHDYNMKVPNFTF